MRRLHVGVVAAFAAIYLIWGSTYLAIKLALVSVPPFTMTATRSFTAGAMLYAWGRWRGAPPPTRAQWGGGAAVGMLLFLGGHGGLGWAQQHVPSGVASLFIATIPLWMSLAEVLTDRTVAISPSTVLGIAAGLAGIVLL
ncbi:MAG: EamA family transporter, partial [Gemmatimonadales bacterium]|nr:EamA family transporter [Gemmatimonadales bacterium]